MAEGTLSCRLSADTFVRFARLLLGATPSSLCVRFIREPPFACFLPSPSRRVDEATGEVPASGRSGAMGTQLDNGMATERRVEMMLRWVRSLTSEEGMHVHNKRRR